MRVYYDDLFFISWYILFLIFVIYIIRSIIIFRIIIKALVTIIVCVIFKGFIFVVILNNFLADKVSSDVETSSFKLVLVSVTKNKINFFVPLWITLWSQASAFSWFTFDFAPLSFDSIILLEVSLYQLAKIRTSLCQNLLRSVAETLLCSFSLKKFVMSL